MKHVVNGAIFGCGVPNSVRGANRNIESLRKLSYAGKTQTVDDASGSLVSKPAAKAERRKRKYPFRKSVDIELDIAKLEAKITDLEAALLTPEVYKDGEKVKRTMADAEEAKDLLADTYEHWEEAVELNG